jgi:hypothetical protein
MQMTHRDKRKDKDLEHDVSHILEEARMVLPGIQALLGFQLVAVFNQAFSEKLSMSLQYVHLGAILFSLAAIMLLLAPAALHRQCQPYCITPEFARISSFLVATGMFPLMFSFTCDWFVVAWLVTKSDVLSGCSSFVVFAAFLGLWFIMPRWYNSKRRPGVDLA